MRAPLAVAALTIDQRVCLLELDSSATLPKSTYAMRPSASAKMLPGCGVAMEQPKLTQRNKSTIGLLDVNRMRAEGSDCVSQELRSRIPNSPFSNSRQRCRALCSICRHFRTT